MDGYRSAKTRRREHAAAVACALGLFVALVAGSALRPHYSANSLPEPAAWAHTIKDGQPDATNSHPLRAMPALTSVRSGSPAHSAPTSRKPFRYVWMTHDLPSNWDPLSPQTDWSVLPKSFTAAQFQPRGAPLDAPTAAGVIRHPLSLFSIIRC